jgi:hypothetical protein
MSLHCIAFEIIFVSSKTISFQITPNNQELHLAKISEFLTTKTEFAQSF